MITKKPLPFSENADLRIATIRDVIVGFTMSALAHDRTLYVRHDMMMENRTYRVWYPIDNVCFSSRISQFFSLSGFRQIFPFFSLIFDPEGNSRCVSRLLISLFHVDALGPRLRDYVTSSFIFLRINQFSSKLPFLFSFSLLFLICISSHVYIYVISRVIGKLESNR